MHHAITPTPERRKPECRSAGNVKELSWSDVRLAGKSHEADHFKFGKVADRPLTSPIDRWRGAGGESRSPLGQGDRSILETCRVAYRVRIPARLR